jgi:hypothetical protein
VWRIKHRGYGPSLVRRAPLPSPLAGEGGEPAKTGEPGEGFFAVRKPLTRTLASLASTLSRKGRGYPSALLDCVATGNHESPVNKSRQ